MLETILDCIAKNVLEIILTIISLTVSYYLIPCIKNDFVPWLKEKRLYNIVKFFVEAAEKMAESNVIEKVDKKKKVVELLTNKGIKVDKTVEALIESCVKELDIATSIFCAEVTKEELEAINDL